MSGPDNGDHACPSSDRRREDEQLLSALRATTFHGKQYDRFVACITDYAAGVLWKMVRDEQIWAELGKIQRPRTPPIYWCERDKEELITDSVADGFLDFFQKVLVESRWDPSRASLNTLFIRYCLSRFADHYQAWQRQSLVRLGQQVVQRDPDCRGPQQAPSAERVAVAREAVTELRKEQFAHGAGYSYKEIGHMQDISERAVEGRLYRSREKNPENGHG